MTDSKVRIGNILLQVLDILIDHLLRSISTKAPNTTRSFQTSGLKRLSYQAFDPSWRNSTVGAMTSV